MLKRLILFLSIIFIFLQPCFSENKEKMDSLKVLLTLEKNDTSKLNIYIKLLQECDQKNNFYYGNLLVDFTDKKVNLITDKKIKHKFEIARVNGLQAVNGTFDRKTDSAQQFNYFLKKHQYYLSKKDIRGYVQVTRILASEYSVLGNIMQSVLFYKEGILNANKYQDRIGEGMLLEGLTKNLFLIGDTAEALINLKKAIDIYTIEKDSNNLASGYRMLGHIYSSMGKEKFKKLAISYFEKALKNKFFNKKLRGLFIMHKQYCPFTLRIR